MTNSQKKSATMEQLLSNTNRTLKTFRYGEVVEGTVISVGRKEVFVDLGSKSEGIISEREFEDETDSIAGLEVGDTVVASVTQTENDQGYIILSLKKAQSERSWREIEGAFKNETVLEAKVVDSNKGGLVVEISGGLRGFVPFSHLNKPPSPDSSSHPPMADPASENLKVRVIELNRPINRLVFSEKLATLLSDPEVKKFFRNLKPNEKLKGVVTSIFPFGVFVQLRSGVEGLVHISEMSWRRIDHPSDIVKAGDEVEVVVLSINREQGKLALSMKPLRKNPWEEVAEKYKVGETVVGTVTKTVPFGAFVKLPEGIEGLIHVSETVGPLAEGEEVKVVIINLEPEKQKLGLSIKQLEKSLEHKNIKSLEHKITRSP